MPPVISDEKVARTLARFAALAHRLLDDPGAWLDDEEPAEAPSGVRGRLGAAADAVRDRLAGEVHPGDAAWDTLPPDDRADWWVDRVRALAVPVAASPRVAGLAADRLPLQGALGAAAQGLAVCAVAREHGVNDPQRWVPLLGRILFDRDLRDVAEPAPPSTDDRDEDRQATAEEEAPGPLRRGARRLWQLARLLLELHGLFDERPRGALPFRMLGKVPVVGLLGGVLDERGAVRRAADEARGLLREGWLRR